MFSIKHILEMPYGYHNYIWLDVLLIKETQKAILIKFDGREIWLPKAWILKIKRDKHSHTARIKISLYHWAKKAQ